MDTLKDKVLGLNKPYLSYNLRSKIGLEVEKLFKFLYNSFFNGALKKSLLEGYS